LWLVADPTCDPHTDLQPDALPAPAFQRAVLAGIGAYPGVAGTSLGPFRIRVSSSTADTDTDTDTDTEIRTDLNAEVHLDELFKDYRHGRIAVGGAVEEIAAALGLPGAAARAAGPFPRLARRGELDPGICHQPCPFDPELVVYYVRELPHSRRHVPIRAAELPLNGVGADGAGSGEVWADAAALHAAALAKLSERTHQVPADSQGEGARLVIGYNSGDGFDAARALLPDLMGALAGWLPGRMHVALPTRDLLFAVGDADPEFLAGARAHARQAYEAGPERLSALWYVWGADGLAVMDG
jgi:hypothetical protein